MRFSKVIKVVLLAALLTLLVPLAIARGQTVGTAVVRDSGSPPAGNSSTHQLNLGDQIGINLTSLAPLAAAEVYEGWLVTDDGSESLSVGVFSVDDSGNVSQTYTNPDGVNLISKFGQFMITVEPVPDSDPGPSGVVSHIHTIPADGLVHVRHLLYSWKGNPAYTSGPHAGTAKGILAGLQEQASTALFHSILPVSPTTLDDVKSQAGQIINIIEGEAGPNYDASWGNPGDGFGVLNYAADQKHAGLATVGAPGAVNITKYEPWVRESANNAAAWSTQARDQALFALGADSAQWARLYVSNARTLLTRALNGYDTDRNGAISPGGNEGGAIQAYTSAQLQATYTPAPPPDLPETGGIDFSVFALTALLVGIFLLGSGTYLYRKGMVRA